MSTIDATSDKAFLCMFCASRSAMKAFCTSSSARATCSRNPSSSSAESTDVSAVSFAANSHIANRLQQTYYACSLSLRPSLPKVLVLLRLLPALQKLAISRLSSSPRESGHSGDPISALQSNRPMHLDSLVAPVSRVHEKT